MGLPLWLTFIYGHGGSSHFVKIFHFTIWLSNSQFFHFLYIIREKENFGIKNHNFHINHNKFPYPFNSTKLFYLKDIVMSFDCFQSI